MIHFIPDWIKANSGAEARLFQLMQRAQIAEEWYCYHSLNLPQHAYKRNGEIDFLLLGPRELFCLEVKGGRIACHNGVWSYTDRYNVSHRNTEGPFGQARSAMYALRDRIREHHTLIDPEAALVLGYGVVFPDSSLPVTGEEWSQEIVLEDHQMTENGFRQFLQRLRTFWGARQRVPADLTPTQGAELRQFLRPDFEMVPSLRASLEEIDGQVNSLTDDQYRIIDSLNSMPRLLCRGGAGTGKTMLALESARRAVARGDAVLLVCASPVLAAVLKTRVDSEKIRICAIGEFRHRTLHNSSGELRLPGWAREKSVDLLIVDEGQDCLTYPHLDLFDTILRQGLEGGRWQIFFDPENQGGIYGELNPDVIPYLESCHPATPSLAENCRNTDRIIRQIEVLTGNSAGSPRIRSQEQVKINTYLDSTDQVRKVSALLDHLLRDQKIAPGDVTILTPQKLTLSAVGQSSISRRADVRVLDEQSLPEYPFVHLTLSSIKHFKGLDNRIIILTGIESFEDPVGLYVGMTRARTKLYLFVHQTLEGEIEKRVDDYIEHQLRKEKT